MATDDRQAATSLPLLLLDDDENASTSADNDEDEDAHKCKDSEGNELGTKVSKPPPLPASSPLTAPEPGGDVANHAVDVNLCYHLGFTGLVQLRDGLFQLFVGITISS